MIVSCDGQPYLATTQKTKLPTSTRQNHYGQGYRFQGMMRRQPSQNNFCCDVDTEVMYWKISVILDCQLVSSQSSYPIYLEIRNCEKVCIHWGQTTGCIDEQEIYFSYFFRITAQSFLCLSTVWYLHQCKDLLLYFFASQDTNMTYIKTCYYDNLYQQDDLFQYKHPDVQFNEKTACVNCPATFCWI